MKQYRVTTRAAGLREGGVPRQWRDHTTIVEAADENAAIGSAEAAHRNRMAADGVPHWRDVELAVVSWQEVVEGTVEVKVYATRLRVGDIVLPSRVRVLEKPVPDPDAPGKVRLVTTGDQGSQEPKTRSWRADQRLLVERPADARGR